MENNDMPTGSELLTPPQANPSNQIVGRLEADDCRRLVIRITSSRIFAKSPRLSSFLIHVCSLADEGRNDEINEQAIGYAVFERDDKYDPAFDSIVRSHASRLRSRLQEYFDQEGASEPILLTIPRGGYVPAYDARPQSVQNQLDVDVPTILTSRQTVPESFETNSISVEHLVGGELRDEDPASVRRAPKMWSADRRIVVTASLISLLLIVASLAFGLSQRRSRLAATGEGVTEHPLWGQLFRPREQSVVVIADSGLVMLQGFTKKRVELESYLSGDYLKEIKVDGLSQNAVLNLVTRRYTSMVDFVAEGKILALLGSHSDEAIFRYSRDLRVDDLKGRNIIILGTYESTPWVQLFEGSMNFYFVNRITDGVFSAVNRHPQPGEQAQYDRLENDSTRTVYGLVAFRPNLNHSGNVLILEGQTMAGTQSAIDFVFDDVSLRAFLRKINRSGKTPHFELLLRSTSFGGQSSKTDIIAYRIEND